MRVQWTMSTVSSTLEQGKGVVLVQKEVVSQIDSKKESQSAAKEVGHVSHDSEAQALGEPSAAKLDTPTIQDVPHEKEAQVVGDQSHASKASTILEEGATAHDQQMGADMSIAEGAGGVMCSSQISCINSHHGRVVPNSNVDVFFAGRAGELMGIASVSNQVPPKEYTVILDLNKLLIHWIYHRSSPIVHVRPGLMDFLI